MHCRSRALKFDRTQRRSTLCAPRALGAPCAHRSIGSNRSGSGLVHTSVSILSSPYFWFCRSVPDFGPATALVIKECFKSVRGCEHHPSPRAQPWGPDRRRARRPCGTGSRWLYFICRDQPAAAGAPSIVALCASRDAASGGPAGFLAYVGAEGHVFFYRRFSPAMRREPPKSGSQTLQRTGARAHVHDHGVFAAWLDRNRFWFRRRYGRGMTAFFGFGATHSRWRGSFFARARSPLVPLCVAPHACATAPGSRPVGCPADVGPEGHPPFSGRIFRACTQPGTGPVLHPSPHTLQHTTPESGRTPGAPAGPGWIFSHRSSVFPSFGDSFGVPHPGTVTAGRCRAVQGWTKCTPTDSVHSRVRAADPQD